MKDKQTIKKKLQEPEEQNKKDIEVQKENIRELTEAILDSNQKVFDDITEQNKKDIEEIEKVTKKIEKINRDILKFLLSEEDFKQFTKEDKIQFTIDIKLNENQKEQIEKFNGNFISEKVLLTIPYLLEGITQGEELESFKKDYEDLSKQIDKKQKYLDKYYELYNRIDNANKKIGKLQTSLLDRLPHFEVFEGDGKQKGVDLLDEKNFDKFTTFITQANANTIDSSKMFEYSQRVESEYKISFNYDETIEKLQYTFEKALNFTNHFFDISNPTIKKLQDEIDSLKKENASLKSEEPEEIKQFKPTPIEKVVSFNDKISNNFGNLENGTNNLIAKTGGKKKSLKDSDIQVYIENSTMTTSNPLEPFDRIVLQTIYSVLQENTNFDIQMLRKTMSGITNRNGTKLDDEIEKSINKLWTTLIEIKIPEELKQTFKDTDFEWESIKGTLLPLIELKGKKGGKQVKLYGLEANPIYYSYVKAKGQLQTKDTKLLQTGTATKENVLIIDYLTTRIEDMKHKKNCDDNLKNIKLESIWELIETEEDKAMTQKSLNQKRKRRQKDIEEILKNYVSIKYIKSYSKTKTGFKIEI